MRRYKDIQELKTDTGIRYNRNAYYPEIPLSEDDIYIITTGGDRYDTLALQFYKDSSLWWIIASANVSKRDGLIVKQGVQLRIPADKNKVIEIYKKENNI